MIWFNKNLQLADISALGKNTMGDHIGIEFIETGADFIKGRMPVDDRTKQPAGLLHGGASCVLAETLGSVASALILDLKEFVPVGLEINANHIRPVTSGEVIGRAEAVHIGRTTHVWDI